MPFYAIFTVRAKPRLGRNSGALDIQHTFIEKLPIICGIGKNGSFLENKRRYTMNTTLKRTITIIMAAGTLAIAFSGCRLLKPSKTSVCSCDRGSCTGCGPATQK